MRVTGVSHIPIRVRDLEKSLVFWRDFMGMSVTGDTGETFGYRRNVFLRWDDDKTSVFISLCAFKDRELTGSATSLGERGVDHIAFWVDDLDAYGHILGEIAEGCRLQGIGATTSISPSRPKSSFVISRQMFPIWWTTREMRSKPFHSVCFEGWTVLLIRPSLRSRLESPRRRLTEPRT